MSSPQPSQTLNAIQWTGDNLDEVMDFTGFRCFFDFDFDLMLMTSRHPKLVEIGEYVIRNGDDFDVCSMDIIEQFRISGPGPGHDPDPDPDLSDMADISDETYSTDDRPFLLSED